MTTNLPTKMKALVCYGPKDYRLEEKEVPKPGSGEILIKVSACGICAGDAKCFCGAPHFWGDANRPRYCQPPVIPGHEFIGTVAALGPDTEDTGFSLGDQVISEQIIPCYKCLYCKKGKYWLCEIHDIYGFHQNCQGGMAEYMIFPKGSRNYKVPKELDPLDAVFIEPLSCSLHAVERANIELGDVCVVSGCGPLGLGIIAGSRLKNPKILIAIDFFDWKLEIAKKCGADLVLNPSKVNVVDEIKKLTEGYGCDVYIEAAGHPSSVNQGLMSLRKSGTFVEFSVFMSETVSDWTVIGDGKELTIYGSHLSAHNYPIAISMILKKQIPVRDIITHVLSLDKWKEGFDMVISGKESIKVVLKI